MPSSHLSVAEDAERRHSWYPPARARSLKSAPRPRPVVCGILRELRSLRWTAASLEGSLTGPMAPSQRNSPIKTDAGAAQQYANVEGRCSEFSEFDVRRRA